MLQAVREPAVRRSSDSWPVYQPVVAPPRPRHTNPLLPVLSVMVAEELAAMEKYLVKPQPQPECLEF